MPCSSITKATRRNRSTLSSCARSSPRFESAPRCPRPRACPDAGCAAKGTEVSETVMLESSMLEFRSCGLWRSFRSRSREGSMSHVRRFGSIVFTGVRRAVHSDRFLAGAVALVFTYLLFCDYLPPFRRVHLWSDISGYHLPLQAYAHDALKEGRIPLWDSTIYCGISFIGNVQAALLYPPNWLLYAATWRLLRLPFQALQIFTFLSIYGWRSGCATCGCAVRRDPWPARSAPPCSLTRAS